MKYLEFNSSNFLCARYDSTTNHKIPKKAIKVSDELFWQTVNETDGVWIILDDGSIVKRPHTPEVQISNLEIENKRLIAYSDPIHGSDRYFCELLSLQAEGYSANSSEVKQVKAKGLAKKLEIKTQYPYHEE